jgi:dolichyl-phosphate-mannose-protein mannosyltransferase
MDSGGVPDRARIRLIMRATSAYVGPWGRIDWLAISLVTLGGGITRFWHLGTPGTLVFDEAYYAPDACTLVHSASACGVAGTFSKVHPILGKWIIGLGIDLFGHRPFGWRVAAAIFGTVSIILLFLLARRLLRSTAAATFAAAFLALDGLSFVQSRLAMLDVFVATFALATFLFVVLDRDRERHADERFWDRRWLLAAGVAGGAAMATKWSGIPFVAAAAVLVFAWDARATRDLRVEHPIGRTLRKRAGVLIVAFVALPLVVYVASFVGGLDAPFMTSPWDRGSWVRAFLGWQKHILTFGIDLHGVHPYTSPAWSWPLLKRPVVYHIDVSGGAYREIIALGNPAIWWPAILATAACVVRWLRRRDPEGPDGAIIAGLVAGWAWWLPVTSVRTFSFLFYLTPAIPFLCLALARVLQLTWPNVVGRIATGAVAAAVLGLFVFFYPVLAAAPLTAEAWSARLWFTDCRPESLTNDDPPIPLTKTAVPPPSGWCWI